MKVYITSLIVGIGVGVIYSLVNVRSPAPPTWALIGLLGMLMGEQLSPFAKQHLFNQSAQDNSVQIQTTEAPKNNHPK